MRGCGGPTQHVSLAKETPSDDIEAYLLTFERTAEREEWPADQWVGLIAPFLSGIAQNTFQDLATDPMITYTALKGEIMKRYSFTLITRAQHYHDWVCCVSPTRPGQNGASLGTHGRAAIREATPGPPGTNRLP